MTSFFDDVAASLANLPEVERTHHIREAWKHGIELRDSGITDIILLVETVMSKTPHEDVNDFITECILCETVYFISSTLEKERRVSALLRLFQGYTYHDTLGEL